MVLFRQLRGMLYTAGKSRRILNAAKAGACHDKSPCLVLYAPPGIIVIALWKIQSLRFSVPPITHYR
jgi:hypothetical protein